MKCLAPGQHRKNHFHASLPRFRLLCRLQPIGDRIAIRFVERLKESLRFLISPQRRQKIIGKSCFAWGIIGYCPTSVFLRGIDLGSACRFHSARCYQPLRMLRVDLRPTTFRTPRGESLPPRNLVVTLFLAVDPAEAECLVQRLSISYGWLSRVFLENTQPNPIGLMVILSEPLTKLRG